MRYYVALALMFLGVILVWSGFNGSGVDLVSSLLGGTPSTLKLNSAVIGGGFPNDVNTPPPVGGGASWVAPVAQVNNYPQSASTPAVYSLPPVRR